MAATRSVSLEEFSGDAQPSAEESVLARLAQRRQAEEDRRVWLRRNQKAFLARLRASGKYNSSQLRAFKRLARSI